MEVEITVPESKLASIKEGQEVTLSFWAVSDLSLLGRIREISPIADVATRTYKTRVSIISPPESIRYGMTANVFVAEDEQKQGAVLPLTAIYQTDTQPNVWLVKDGAVTLHKVELENFGDDNVRVKSGLSEGDIVVTKGVHKLREGQKVRFDGEGL